MDYDSLVDEQEKLEHEAVSLGQQKVRDQLRNLREKGMESETSYGRTFISWAVPELSAAINEWLDTARQGKPTDAAVTAKRLLEMDTDVIAFLTLKAMMNNTSAVVRIQTISVEVAQLIEDEIKFSAIEEQDPKYFHRMKEKLKKQGSNYQHARIAFTAPTASLEHVEVPESWTKAEKHTVGSKLVSLAVEVTGLFEVKVEPSKAKNRKGTYVISPSDKLIEWQKRNQQKLEMSSPKMLPMVIPPKDWTTPSDGGYWFHLADQVSLVKDMDRAYQEDLESRDMPQVYNAVNRLQRTPWAINSFIHEVAVEAWRTGTEIPYIYNGHELPIPPRPPEADNDVDVHSAWKREAAATYSENIRRKSKAGLTAQILWMSNKMKNYPEFYFVHSLDFRGRVYPVTPSLNPQGSDLAKGLLQFAHGERLGRSGVVWLAIHLANTYGYDKDTLENRRKWTLNREDKILQAAKDPMGAGLPWWEAADKPWEHLAACREWMMYRTYGEDYISCLPVNIDATCSGIQVFSALLRDYEGGASVNLVPQEKPADVYGRILGKLSAVVEAEAAGEDPNGNAAEEYNQEMARRWLASGELDRQLVKRPVMTTPYGAKLWGYREQIQDEMKGREKHGILSNTCYWESLYLAKRLWAVAEDTLSGALEVMKYLQKIARLAGKEQRPVVWTAPQGFPVKQAYWDTRQRAVKTHWAGGVVKKVRLAESLDTINKSRQSNGIGPNVVHSIDAALMMRAVNKFVQAKTGDWNDNHLWFPNIQSVHDSFGTTPGSVNLLFNVLREAFVDVFQHDEDDGTVPVFERIVEELTDQLSEEAQQKVPKKPEYGTLDVREAKASKFLFS